MVLHLAGDSTRSKILLRLLLLLLLLLLRDIRERESVMHCHCMMDLY
jgi:hypothetical protein